MDPKEKEYYEKIVIALMSNENFYDREKYNGRTDEDIATKADKIAKELVRLRAEL